MSPDEKEHEHSTSEDHLIEAAFQQESVGDPPPAVSGDAGGQGAQPEHEESASALIEKQLKVDLNERGADNIQPSFSESSVQTGSDMPLSPAYPDRLPAGPLPDVPGFALVRRLGVGGFGQVWLARSTTGVYRAVKFLPKGSLTDIEFSGIRTYEVHARGHAHLISILHVGETPDWLYYVMELADGYKTAPTFQVDDYEPRTLESDLRRSGRLNLDDAIVVTRQILAGLEHLHRHELLHRDIKPANVVYVDGVVKLADIGFLTQERRRESNCLTRLYAPPEGITDRSGDLYCLAKTLYEMITGLPARRFPEVPGDVGEAQIDTIRQLIPILTRACSAKPDDRFQSVDEFRRALDRQVQRPSRRRIFALTAAAAVASIAVGAWLLSQHGPAGNTGQSGRIDVFFTQSDEDELYYKVDSNSIPLRTSQLIRTKVFLDPPAYPVFAVLTASDRRVQIAYPRPEDLDRQKPVSELPVPIPTDDKGWWTLDPPKHGAQEETLTFVLIAGRQPVRDLDKIAELLSELGEIPTVDSDSMFVWKDGQPQLVRATRTGSRTVDVDRTVKARAGMLDRLAEPVEEGFKVVYAVAVPQSSESRPAD